MQIGLPSASSSVATSEGRPRRLARMRLPATVAWLRTCVPAMRDMWLARGPQTAPVWGRNRWHEPQRSIQVRCVLPVLVS